MLNSSVVIQLVITLLGRLVHQLNANIKSANHVEQCDPCDFDCGMIVGARQGGLSISETDVDVVNIVILRHVLEWAVLNENVLCDFCKINLKLHTSAI